MLLFFTVSIITCILVVIYTYFSLRFEETLPCIILECLCRLGYTLIFIAAIYSIVYFTMVY